MSGCDFSDATAERTNFSKTNLIGSDFSGLVFNHTWFDNCALHGIKGKPLQPEEAFIEAPDYSERGDGSLIVTPERVLIAWGGSP
jgi:uncharacterized protein YjbI with pentapeptide repeats